MSYIILIIVVVVIAIIAFIVGVNSRNGKKTSSAKLVRGSVDIEEDKIDELMKNAERHKNDILEVIREETNRQNQLSGTSTHLAEDIKGVTEHIIEKKLDISERLIEICLSELEKDNKIKRMRLPGATTHYILVV